MERLEAVEGSLLNRTNETLSYEKTKFLLDKTTGINKNVDLILLKVKKNSRKLSVSLPFDKGNETFLKIEQFALEISRLPMSTFSNTQRRQNANHCK